VTDLATGFDTASAITDVVLDKAVADGCKFIELYIKYSTPDLVKRIHAKGLAIGLIWETAAERALAGHRAGYVDALSFIAMIPTKLGSSPPASVAPAWTADFDTTVLQQPAVLQYGQGWKDAMATTFRKRCYANGAICAAALAASIVDFTWVAGGKGMRGTVAFLKTGKESEYQDVGDQEHLNEPISIDSDVATDVTVPWAWWPSPATDTTTTTQQTVPSQPVTVDPVVTALKVLQTVLHTAGFYTGEIDGIWGSESMAALDAWERSHK
jgi:hypothetical protein